MDKKLENMLNKIEVNTQSSVRIEAEKIIYVDPFKILEEKYDADLIFITHSHYDHYSPEDIRKVIKKGTTIVCPKDMEKLIKSDFDVSISGFANSDEMQTNDTKNLLISLEPDIETAIEGIQVETVPAYNKLKPFHPKKNNWLGYILTIDGIRIYLAGDTDKTEEAEGVKCDIAMIPIGGYYTMDFKQAAELINKIQPQVAIPIHYGSIVGKKEDANKFNENVEEKIEVIKKL